MLQSRKILCRQNLPEMKVVGIDAGYVNFAVCGLDSQNLFRPYYWKNSPLFTGPFSEERLARAVYEWITDPEVEKLLAEADVIVLERQMQKRFQAVNHCVRFRHFEKTVEVNPNAVGKFFNLPLDRKPKKKAAVELVSSHVVLPVRKGKKDDLADAFLLALFKQIENRRDEKQGWQYAGDGTERKRSRVEDNGEQLEPKRGRHKKSGASRVQGSEPIKSKGGEFRVGNYLFSL